MKSLNVFFLIASFFVFLSVYGCKDTITGDQIDKRIIPDKDVSYSKDLQAVFDVKCNYSGCHEDASRAGGLSLTSWANTTADPTIVFPGDPDNSILIWAIEAKAGIPSMPPVRYPPLTVNQINGIKTWIKEGAKNN